MTLFSVSFFEVHVREERRWILHARFPREEMHEALAEAKLAERRLHTRAKVVRSVYYPQSNNCEEFVVYVTPKAESPARRKSSRQGARPQSTAGLAWRLTTVLLSALLLAGLVTAATAALLTVAVQLVGGLEFRAFPHVLFGVFMLSFGLASLPRILHMARAMAAQSRGRPPAAAVPARRQPDAPPTTVPSAPPPAAPVPAAPPAAEAPPEAIPEPPPIIEPMPPLAPDDEPAPPVVTPPQQPHHTEMMRFLSGAIAALQQGETGLDAYNRFGINLLLAGASDALAARSGFDAVEQARLLREAMELTGTVPQMSAAFCEIYEEYLLEPRYQRMIQAGHGGMLRLLDHDALSEAPLLDAFAEWNAPAARGAATTGVVMATRLHGLAALSAALGAEGAQAVRRRHDALARTVMARHGGIEVRHDGESVLGCFASATEAAAAAGDMQREAALIRGRDGVPLALAIGLEAGEWAEDGDVAASAAAATAGAAGEAAAAEQVLCTAAVKALVTGYCKLSRDAVAVLDGPAATPLFAIHWREEAVSEDAAEPSAPAGRS